MRVLIVDDEENVVELVKFNLELHGFECEYSYDGEEGSMMAKSNTYNLIILDIMLPNKNGLQILKEIRDDSINSDTPILMLTAKSEEIDFVAGLDLGADDYLSKPFRIHEFVARAKSLVRRVAKSVSAPKDVLESDDLSINVSTRTVTVSGEPVSMTKKEFDLLHFLVRNKGIVFSRDELLNQIWGYDYYGESRTVDVHIRNVRKKTEVGFKNEKHITTIVGVGYKFE